MPREPSIPVDPHIKPYDEVTFSREHLCDPSISHVRPGSHSIRPRHGSPLSEYRNSTDNRICISASAPSTHTLVKILSMISNVCQTPDALPLDSTLKHAPSADWPAFQQPFA